ncbi:hypothetical protein RHMOL_Rhmol06G0174900 [Rhododendron molle]|uniref:Uncharacterized protein n=1 Tax=Rhododendron molle TaxID=49168 RepID=A0ACC0ND82_RHOML|nr:hypothetical protein RHMOL_Rhmol06G0174900 [Rhododendron molle]
MNVPPVFSPKAASGVIPVKLLDYFEEVSSPVVPIPAPVDGPCLGSNKPKWVDVVAPSLCASASSRMNLSYFPPQLRDSKVVVCPPQDVVDQGSDLWSDCIVGYFLDKKVPFPLVKNIVMRIWEKFGIYDVRANDQGFFFFKFSKVDAYRSLMETGPCHIAGKLMILKQWEPQMVLTKEKLSTIPIWVQFSNLPLELWTAQGLSYIASGVGKPLYADDLTEKGLRLSFAKICVEVTVDSPLPDVVEVEYANGASASVVAKYPWKPTRCSECRVFGHTEARHKVPVVEVGAKAPPPVLSSPGQVVRLLSDESIEQGVVYPVAPVLNASDTLGPVPFSTTSRSPSVLLAQGNVVVMTDGVASDLSVSGRGLVEMVPHAAIRSQGSPVDKVSRVTPGFGMNRCSNIFSILESTLPDDTAFQEELLQQGGKLLVDEGSGNGCQAIEALGQADFPPDSDLVVTPPPAAKKKGRGRGGGGDKKH